MTALEDETDDATKTYGHVMVTIISSRSCSLNITKLLPKMYMVMEGLPIREVAHHICVLEDALNPILRYLLTTCPKRMRVRSRIHIEGMYRTKFIEYILCVISFLV